MSDLISIETFFAAPEFSRAVISPDGHQVAYLAPWSGRLNVFVCDVGETSEMRQRQRRITSDTNRNIEGFCWTPDSTAILYLQDMQGNENWHLYQARADVEAPPQICLSPFPEARVMDFAFSTSDPETLFVQMNARDPALVDLHRLNTRTGAIETVAENPGRFVRWLVIPDGVPHAIIVNPDNDYDLARYENGEFIHIATIDGTDNPLGPHPCVPSPDGKSLWIGSNRGTDRLRLARIDLYSGEETEIDSHPEFDLDAPRPEGDPRFPSALILNSATGALLGARYLGARQVIHALDDDFACVLPQLAALSTDEIGHVSCDAAGRNWVVEFTNDRQPGVTWLYDHLTGQAKIIGCRQPNLDTNRLAAVRPITVASRDGLQLPCHLTLPAGKGHRNLPTVLLVHGGPWYRDSAFYDPEVQFLANRGYAVLQVNFRGSTGYGKAFTQAARREFAGRMHDDLIDALDWSIDEGFSDPNRVAIYGCSYGGYSALVGASFTPERFAAAISYSGMSDLRVLVDGAVAFIREMLVNNYLAYMGDPSIPSDNAEMLARSPVSRLDEIQCPLLVIHGAQDVRVAPAQAEAVVDHLRAQGREVEFLLNPREGHWFYNQDSNYELYRVIEGFLSRQIGQTSSHVR